MTDRTVDGIDYADNRHLVEQTWKAYRGIIPTDAPKIQLDETHLAFYGGAFAMFTLLNHVAEEDDPLQTMDFIQAELFAFLREVIGENKTEEK